MATLTYPESKFIAVISYDPRSKIPVETFTGDFADCLGWLGDTTASMQSQVADIRINRIIAEGRF
jgi:hypothetical protein